jgi:hypothetical protein
MRRMLHFDPARRVNIDDVFFHPWIGGRTRFHTIYKLIKSRGVLLCLIISICAIELVLLTYTLPSQPLKSSNSPHLLYDAVFGAPGSRLGGELLPVRCVCNIPEGLR